MNPFLVHFKIFENDMFFLGFGPARVETARPGPGGPGPACDGPGRAGRGRILGPGAHGPGRAGPGGVRGDPGGDPWPPYKRYHGPIG